MSYLSAFDISQHEQTLYEQVVARIDDTPDLEPYRDEILYDWPEGDEHLNWALTAPAEEIIDWARTIAYDEAAAVYDDEEGG